MKTVLISTMLLALSFLTYGQATLSELSQSTFKNDTTFSNNDYVELSKTEPVDYTLAHNQSAISQLQSHLTSNIKFSEIIQKNNITGTLKVKVYLSKDGSIKKVKISKNAHPELVTSVNLAMSTFEKVLVNEPSYQGDVIFLIPINFSIEH